MNYDSMLAEALQVEQKVAPDMPWIKECVLNGHYGISEHILRYLTSGKLTLTEIETSLIDGRIVELRRNRQKRLGSIVRGRVGNKTISTLCAKDNGQCMVVLLAYLEPCAGWDKDHSIQPMRGQMTENNERKCFFCGGKIKPIVVGNFDYRIEGRLYVIKKVSAGLCEECGEKFVTADTAKKINRLIEKGDFSGTEEVRVIDRGMFD